MKISRYKSSARVGPVIITADRWPWQIKNHKGLMDVGPGAKPLGERYGWKPVGGMGRFGGGWNWEFGFMASGGTIIVMLLYGTLRFAWNKGSEAYPGAVARYEKARKEGK
jgi:hypothetical protein